jgi:hypothetical protein
MRPAGVRNGRLRRKEPLQAGQHNSDSLSDVTDPRKTTGRKSERIYSEVHRVIIEAGRGFGNFPVHSHAGNRPKRQSGWSRSLAFPGSIG